MNIGHWLYTAHRTCQKAFRQNPRRGGGSLAQAMKAEAIVSCGCAPLQASCWRIFGLKGRT